MPSSQSIEKECGRLYIWLVVSLSVRIYLKCAAFYLRPVYTYEEYIHVKINSISESDFIIQSSKLSLELSLTTKRNCIPHCLDCIR